MFSRFVEEMDNLFLRRYNSRPFSRTPISLLEIPQLVHVANFSHGNAGDRLLPVAVRDSINEFVDTTWSPLHAHREVTKSVAQRLNKSDGVVIGGGGLFLRDTNPNELSGWQWSCSIDALESITVPLFVVAVGYNRFRGQEDFGLIFREHLKILASKADFFGLRNTGSLEALKEYLPADLHSRLTLQPCPTTVLAKIYPDRIPAWDKDEKWSVAFNCAFDRQEMRYGDTASKRLLEIAHAALRLSKDAPIRYYCHVDTDELMLQYFDQVGVAYQRFDLHKMSASEIIDLYSEPVVTVGTRGHSQMIPAGCIRPFVSLATHEKLWYFLDDIGHREWGIDIGSAELEEEIVSGVSTILGSTGLVRTQLEEVLEENWRRTASNFTHIADVVSGDRGRVHR